MAAEHVLICDRCGGRRNVERHIVEFGPDAAWSMDLDPKCHARVVGDISALLDVPRTSRRIARANRATVNGDIPYRAAAGVSLTDARRWAQAHGLPVSGRGRIKAQVLDLYRGCLENGDRWLSTREAQRVLADLEPLN